MKLIRVIIILMSIFLQGCRPIDINVENKITPPKSSELHVKGVWKIEEYKSLNNKINQVKFKNYIDKVVIIDENIAAVDEEVFLNPKYKVKSVSANNFFEYRHNIDHKSIGIKGENVDIISVSDSNQIVYDFIKISDNQLALYKDQGLLLMNKISNNTDEYISKLNLNNTNNNLNNHFKEDKLLRSGVILGLRSDNLKESKSEYRTLWISSRNRKLQNTIELSQLFVPRRSGFWEVGMDREIKDGKLIQSLYAHPVIKFVNEGTLSKDENTLQESLQRNITFIGNDYMCTEIEENGQLQVLPIDNISMAKGVNISDLISGNVNDTLTRSLNAFRAAQDKKKVDELEKQMRKDNFTVVRGNGHWVMKGRLNYISPSDNKKFEDFIIYGAPLSTLVNYDELFVPWSEVKARVPEAVDAFTSPNKEIALIVTKNYIYVYSIINGHLSEQPIDKIKIQENESIIMAEWATGDYVGKWNEIIMNNKK